MIERVLEPEVMDSEEDVREYDAMDHAAVNAVFVADLLAALGGWGRGDAEPLVRSTGGSPSLDPSHPITVLDLGVGTAQIPIELCRPVANVRVAAVDAAESMLAIARRNVVAAGLSERIELVLADAKVLPFPAGAFAAVVSNSIVHHIGEPAAVIGEAVRVTAPSGLLFHRDLCRPRDEAELGKLVATYASGATPYQRKLFGDSLRAALSVAEMQQLVARFGFAAETVRMTSDRHWTWIAAKAI